MLRVEIRTDSDEEEISIGTYKLNTCISNSIHVCEFFSPTLRQYEGYVTLDSIEDVERFEYKTQSWEIEQEYCSEERLPSRKYLHLWEGIVYDEKEKYELFEKILKIENASKKVRELFGINKCVLIHGKPGTGKSSLSKAVVQKLAIRRNKVYTLRRIRCSQLFSRFYGESMKILEKTLKECEENTVILVDEADSILMNRSNLFSRNEPGDSLRIVNTLLNILDKSENLLIFTTNFKEELDEAFLSRCDVLFEMKSLKHEHVYFLLKGVFEKIQDFQLFNYFQFSEFSSVKICGSLVDENSLLLFEIAKKIENMSPRQIKKLVFGILEDRKVDVSLAVKKLRSLVDQISLAANIKTK
ncbi:uncharacterized protein VICG_00627 [Vittaforma corneae ATCC 50505]|uniref:AAA+ ATPase domain-containing protein n=1 Tax=Vittaforma corneae (strain ATCC 50505) TaxID=993615 RepID=L2GMV5_VITCO|nr:uncharacterized protein VICG_00627 [Vittaforma corneae ATCC 50505]ELA42228.1 hypothetical protein VICG_00627 [Vittaforma corneae ATCC 50505]